VVATAPGLPQIGEITMKKTITSNTDRRPVKDIVLSLKFKPDAKTLALNGIRLGGTFKLELIGDNAADILTDMRLHFSEEQFRAVLEKGFCDIFGRQITKRNAP
jgi:hypothetical protein